MFEEILSRFDFMELLILLFAVLFAFVIVGIVIGKLIGALTKALHDLNIKRLGLNGAEFYDDPVTGEKKPTRRTLRKKPAVKK